MNLIVIIALNAVSCNLAQRKLASQKKPQTLGKVYFHIWEEQRSKKKTNKLTKPLNRHNYVYLVLLQLT